MNNLLKSLVALILCGALQPTCALAVTAGEAKAEADAIQAVQNARAAGVLGEAGKALPVIPGVKALPGTQGSLLPPPAAPASATKPAKPAVAQTDAPDAPIDVPALTGPVVDLAGLLTGEAAAQLAQTIRQYQAKTGSQIAVLTVPSLGPEPVDDLAQRVADKWQLGRKGIDDGVLIVMAQRERKVRIHVGRGAQGVIPDAVAARIIREQMAPSFKAGNFGEGLAKGVTGITAALSKEALPAPSAAESGQSGPSGSTQSDLMSAALTILFIGWITSFFLGRFLAGAGAGGLLGFVAFSTLGSLMLGGFIGLAAFALIMFLGGGRGMFLSRHGSGWGGINIGSLGGLGGLGGGSGGGSGGSIFSGGGGDFDGGGASGDW